MRDTQLRIGIIGINGRGRLSRYWHQPEGRSVVVGAADIVPEYLDDFRRYGNKDAFITTDYRELIARDDVDAIAVTTPDYCHAEQTVAALEAGKPVFCDKPMAITIDGCDSMIAASRESGQKLMIGFNMRYMHHIRKMKEMIDAGMIGEVKAVWTRHFVGMGSQYYFHDWHALKRNCTSLLLQKGSHDIDVMHFLSGSYTKRVAAFGGRDFYGGDRPDDLKCEDCDDRETCLDATHTTLTEQYPRWEQCCFRKEIDMDDNYVTIMLLESGVKATYMECHFTPDYHRNYTFIGTEGRIENSSPAEKIWYWKRKREKCGEPDETIDIKSLQKDLLSTIGHGGSDERMCKDFVEMVLDDKDPPVPMAAGRMSVAAGCMAQKSLENGGAARDVPPPP